MKNLTFYVVVLIFSCSLSAQVVKTGTGWALQQNNTNKDFSHPQAMGTTYRQLDSTAEVKGTPYYRDYAIGRVFVNNSKNSAGLFRYNVYNDQIEGKKTEDEFFVYGKDENVSYVIDGKTYVVKTLEGKKTYFIELLDNNKLSFLFKPEKIFYPARKKKNSYDTDKLAQFVDDNTYFILDKKKNKYLQVKNLKTKHILKILPEDNRKKQLQTFLKDKNLKLDTEENVCIALKYYANL
ncbi:hypothetical protein ACG2LH_04715 [Zhouia sp. PK063]|uniref:hypothetical protein n=1 Tax=Zhouia sp. PK063 TaxID=3373602 RepID=UPI00378C94A5